VAVAVAVDVSSEAELAVVRGSVIKLAAAAAAVVVVAVVLVTVVTFRYNTQYTYNQHLTQTCFTHVKTVFMVKYKTRPNHVQKEFRLTTVDHCC